MEQPQIYRVQPVLKSNLHTCERPEEEDVCEVLFAAQDGSLTSVRVNTTDCGIAAAEACLYLKNENSRLVHSVKSVRYLPAGSRGAELLDGASNALLTKELNEANKVLVACFVSLCNDIAAAAAEPAAIERALLEDELACNTVHGALFHYRYREGYGAQLGIEDLKARCGDIWGSYVFFERLGLDYCSAMDFKRLESGVQDPEELLFWTFLLCFYGQCDCNYPYTLFMRIRENAFAPYLTESRFPALLHEIVGRDR